MSSGCTPPSTDSGAPEPNEDADEGGTAREVGAAAGGRGVSPSSSAWVTGKGGGLGTSGSQLKE